MFQFHNIGNDKLTDLYDTKIKNKYSIDSVNISKFSNICSICDKKVFKPSFGLPCTNCNKIIHIKCSKPKITSKSFHMFRGNWQCRTCLHDKFVFSGIEDIELENLTFNSNVSENSTKFKAHTPIDDKLKLLLSYKNEGSWYAYSHPNLTQDFICNELDSFAELKPEFKYYEIDQFCKSKVIWEKQKHFGIFHTNICSLQANIDQMEDLLVDLSYKFEILALSETWNPEAAKDKFQPKIIDGYHNYYGVTGSTRKGGCGLYVKESLELIPHTDLEFKITEIGQEVESCWIELINNKGVNELIAVFYRHPSKSNQLFFEKMQAVLKKVNREKKKVSICGDFNFDLLNYDNDAQVSTFLNIMLEYNFQPCITEPTRITNANKPSLVDNIFVNTFENPISGNILEHISYDHLPNFAVMNRDIQEKSISYKKRNTTKYDPEKFQKDLLSPYLFQNILNAEDTDTVYNMYHDRYPSA